MNQEKMVKEIRFLKLYAGISSLIAAVMFLTAFSAVKNAKFTEIDVERINSSRKRRQTENGYCQ